MSQKEIKNAKKTIQNLLYSPEEIPKVYEKFFIHWALLNSFYNACYPGIEGDRKKVTEFGKNFSSLISSLKKTETYNIIVLIKDECVGNGRSYSAPSEYVKKATLDLKKIMNLTEGCLNCRKSKRKACQNVQNVNYTFGPFEAIIRIIYQIRCNLFHGDKLILSGDQFNRDKRLVEASNSILDVVLRQIMV